METNTTETIASGELSPLLNTQIAKNAVLANQPEAYLFAAELVSASAPENKSKPLEF